METSMKQFDRLKLLHLDFQGKLFKRKLTITCFIRQPLSLPLLHLEIVSKFGF